MEDESERQDVGGTPRWVKVFGAVALLVAVLFVVLLVFGGGDHGPRRHGAPAAAATQTA